MTCLWPDTFRMSRSLLELSGWRFQAPVALEFFEWIIGSVRVKRGLAPPGNNWDTSGIYLDMFGRDPEEAG